MSINFSQFPAPTLPIASTDFVVGYQVRNNVPVLAQYTMAQLAVAIGPIIPPVNFGASMLVWFNSLPTTLPGSAGVLWNNGGTLAQS